MSDVALAAVQARYALKGFLREPRTFVLTVILPLFLLVILNAIFRGTSSFFRLQVPFAVYYTPAIISYQIMLAGYSSLLIAVTAERERGMLKRLRGTPMPSWVFLAGEIIRTTVVAAVTVVVLAAVGAGVYHVPVRADTVIGLAVYTVTGTACMCALGLASTRACATTEAAAAAGPFITFILGLVSGVLLPASIMPAWLLDVAELFPLEHLTRGLQQAFAVPGSTGITAIDLAALAAWGAAGLTAALADFRWEPHDSWRRRRHRGGAGCDLPPAATQGRPARRAAVPGAVPDLLGHGDPDPDRHQHGRNGDRGRNQSRGDRDHAVTQGRRAPAAPAAGINGAPPGCPPCMAPTRVTPPPDDLHAARHGFTADGSVRQRGSLGASRLPGSRARGAGRALLSACRFAVC